MAALSCMHVLLFLVLIPAADAEAPLSVSAMQLEAPTAAESFGMRLEGLGDLDGDGDDELAVTDGGIRVHLYLGGEDGLQDPPVLEVSETTHLVQIPEPGPMGCVQVRGNVPLGDQWWAACYDSDGLQEWGRSAMPEQLDLQQIGTVELSDVDGNGLADFADLSLDWQVGGELVTIVRVLAGDPVEVATVMSVIEFPLEGARVGFTAADVDGDGLADLLLSDPDAGNGDGALHLHLGTVSGYDPVPDQTLNGTSWEHLGVDLEALGDIDGDGGEEIAVRGEALVVLTGGADGLSSSPRYVGIGADTGVLTSGDLNGDGAIDLIVSAPPLLFVHLGDGSGGFEMHRIESGTDYGWEARLATGDFNGDGCDDVARAMPWPSLYGTAVGTVDIHLGTACLESEPGSTVHGPRSGTPQDLRGVDSDGACGCNAAPGGAGLASVLAVLLGVRRRQWILRPGDARGRPSVR